MIVLMAGLPGTGKTTLARELARRVGGRLLGKDEFRHAIFQADEIEYSSQQDDICVELMLETARFLLSRDREKIVFVDGRPFSRRYQIENVLTFADAMHQPCRILECVCPKEIVKQRLQKDSTGGGHPAGNRDFSLYLKVKARFETITFPKLVIDTSCDMEQCVKEALGELKTKKPL